MPPRKPKAPAAPVAVEPLTHQETRVNIPTNELRGFMADDERAPTAMRYPRDPSLDPQLVWKGKDEQDAEDLTVPTVPIYIQEEIDPQVIINNLRTTARQGQPDAQMTLFADDNNLAFEEKIDFYRHPSRWRNRMILGDSLLVMNSLAEKEALKGQVQCIFMDPPYGIKFGSNWQISTRKRDVKDGKAEDYTREPEQIRAFRDTWKLGIHSYLAYLRDRLAIARELLTDSGSIFIQIGDENVHLVRCVMDEVFGRENFVSEIQFTKTTSFSGNFLSNVYDTLIFYAKNINQLKFRPLYKQKIAGEEGATTYKPLSNFPGIKIEEGLMTRLATSDQLTSQGASSENVPQAFTFNSHVYHPPAGLHWKTTVEGLKRLGIANRIHIQGKSLRYVRMFDDYPVFPISNLWTDTGTGSFTDPKIYVVQTNQKVIERCILMTTDPGDLVLDPTCGSGTTAYVAEQWGRRWITCDTSRVALSLARQRLMTARFPWYLLADSPEGAKKEADLTGIPAPPVAQYTHDVRRGFIYERVPHITLKSIANNPDIKEGMTREEIDAAIARHADVELLVDKPYSLSEKQKIRVTGPFTMESLSPHRVVSPDEQAALPRTEQQGQRDNPAADFATLVLDNLRRAGVQNTRKGERLKFESLTLHPGRYVQALGDYTDAQDTPRRVAVSIGPEYGAVGPDQIREAAKEAMQGLGVDLLIVCGYAFDPLVGEEAKHYGRRLTVLPTRMNADLLMGDALLKKTGSGNLFMVFGEPDIQLTPLPDGQLQVELLGLDTYNPNTGEIKSQSTDEIACWFIDTQYNGESFFVRHAYFTGAGEPYEKLKKALRAEIDESAWSTLYATQSQPFPRPETHRIAVKVINHYGDEVLKVFQV